MSFTIPQTSPDCESGVRNVVPIHEKESPVYLAVEIEGRSGTTETGDRANRADTADDAYGRTRETPGVRGRHRVDRGVLCREDDISRSRPV